MFDLYSSLTELGDMYFANLSEKKSYNNLCNNYKHSDILENNFRNQRLEVEFLLKMIKEFVEIYTLVPCSHILHM